MDYEEDNKEKYDGKIVVFGINLEMSLPDFHEEMKNKQKKDHPNWIVFLILLCQSISATLISLTLTGSPARKFEIALS